MLVRSFHGGVGYFLCLTLTLYFSAGENSEISSCFSSGTFCHLNKVVIMLNLLINF